MSAKAPKQNTDFFGPASAGTTIGSQPLPRFHAGENLHDDMAEQTTTMQIEPSDLTYDPRTGLPIISVPASLQQDFGELAGTILHFIEPVKKLNRNLASTSPRVCVITDACFYLCTPQGETRRCCLIRRVDKVLVAPNDTMALILQDQHDVVIRTPKVPIILNVLNRVYEFVAGRPIRLQRLSGGSAVQLSTHVRLRPPADYELVIYPIRTKRCLARALNERAERLTSHRRGGTGSVDFRRPVDFAEEEAVSEASPAPAPSSPRHTNFQYTVPASSRGIASFSKAPTAAINDFLPNPRGDEYAQWNHAMSPAAIPGAGAMQMQSPGAGAMQMPADLSARSALSPSGYIPHTTLQLLRERDDQIGMLRRELDTRNENEKLQQKAFHAERLEMERRTQEALASQQRRIDELARLVSEKNLREADSYLRSKGRDVSTTSGGLYAGVLGRSARPVDGARPIDGARYHPATREAPFNAPFSSAEAAWGGAPLDAISQGSPVTRSSAPQQYPDVPFHSTSAVSVPLRTDMSTADRAFQPASSHFPTTPSYPANHVAAPSYSANYAQEYFHRGSSPSTNHIAPAHGEEVSLSFDNAHPGGPAGRARSPSAGTSRPYRGIDLPMSASFTQSSSLPRPAGARSLPQSANTTVERDAPGRLPAHRPSQQPVPGGLAELFDTKPKEVSFKGTAEPQSDNSQAAALQARAQARKVFEDEMAKWHSAAGFDEGKPSTDHRRAPASKSIALSI